MMYRFIPPDVRVVLVAALGKRPRPIKYVTPNFQYL